MLINNTGKSLLNCWRNHNRVGGLLDCLLGRVHLLHRRIVGLLRLRYSNLWKILVLAQVLLLMRYVLSVSISLFWLNLVQSECCLVLILILHNHRPLNLPIRNVPLPLRHLFFFILTMKISDLLVIVQLFFFVRLLLVLSFDVDCLSACLKPFLCCSRLSFLHFIAANVVILYISKLGCSFRIFSLWSATNSINADFGLFL